MARLMINAMYVGLAATCALGLGACNRQASADADGAAAAASAAGAQGAMQPGGDHGAQYAQVVSVTPVRENVNHPQQSCHDEVVSHTVPPKDQHQIAGMAIGAVAGGLLGHMVGHGKGNTLATVAGAVGGGYAGKRIEESRQQGNVESSVVQHCNTVQNTTSKIVGYDVTYVYNGVTHTTRMNHDPGNRVKVEQSVTAVSDAR